MQCRTPRRRHPSHLVRIQQIGLIDGQCFLDGREVAVRRTGGGGGGGGSGYRVSTIHTHNQKGKDKERLGVRGGRPIGGQNSTSKIGFLQRTSAATCMRRYNQIPTDDLSRDRQFDRSGGHPSSLPEDCAAAERRNMNPSHICPALCGLSSRSRCGFLYLPVKHGARAE